ncbi:MAG: hypothetical protein COB32_10700, partial [Halomonas sp.]
GLAKANLHGANDQKVLAGGDRESVGAGFTDSGKRNVDACWVDIYFLDTVNGDQKIPAVILG